MNQSSDNVLNNKINISDSYPIVQVIDRSEPNEPKTTNLNIPTLSKISPVASQMLNCKLTVTFSMTVTTWLPITLDSGATVSFARLSDVTDLGIPIGPNDQLAILADEKTRMASLGEIDTELVIDNIIVRLRALVMENLGAACYGGTTFHTDNNIQADLIAGEVLIHGKSHEAYAETSTI